MKKLIYIYQGSGASQTSARYLQFSMQMALQHFGYDVSFISPRQLADKKNLQAPNLKMLIVGGGLFTEFKNNIGMTAFNNIKDFVWDGGTYCGICMGGYGAFTDIKFKGVEKRTGRGLEFFNTLTHGSLPIAPPFDGTPKSSCVVEVDHLKTSIKMPVFYWGGNGIDEKTLDNIGADPLTKIILPNKQEKIMSARINVGTNGGKAYFSSYHFEAHNRQMIWDWMSKLGHKGHQKDMLRLSQEIIAHPNNAYLMGLCSALDDMKIEENHSFVNAIWPERKGYERLSEIKKLAPLPGQASYKPFIQ